MRFLSVVFIHAALVLATFSAFAQAPNPAYAPVTDVSGLPRVLLVGDSISVGYTLPVRALLKGKANVHRLPENGGPTIRGLKQIDTWIGAGPWDVIHFNWGLHDLKVMEGGKHQVPLDEYRKNLETLVGRMEATGAKLIWASTTPVPEGKLSPVRRSKDVLEFNRVAAEVMDAHNIPTNDLYTAALYRLKEIQRPLNVHFTEEGSEVLAGYVAGAIRGALRNRVSEGGGPDYLGTVQAYADAMIDHGRDVYGTEQTPLFAATLDRATMRLPVKTPPAVPGIRAGDRTLSGANPMHDQNLYQVLYALTEATGDTKYGKAASDALGWFFTNAQSVTTGLYAWGEHLGWDFHTEAPIAGRDTHEFYRPWVLADKAYQLAPEPFERFAVGLWRHQIADHQTGEFSRHARFTEHGPSKGREFPRHGGFYLRQWAVAYERTKNPELAEAIEILVDGFERSRNPESGALPSQGLIPDLAWPQSDVSLAIDLHDSAPLVPPNLAAKLRASAERTDKAFLSIKHDLSKDGLGFIKSADTSTLEPGDPRLKSYPYSRIWATGYGEATDAMIAMLCLMRYEQVKIDGYRNLFLKTADRYLTSDPDTSIALYPGAMAEAIAVMLGAHRLTGESKYLDRADTFGRLAADFFFSDSPLPRASSQHDHYEAITRADTLAMELLALWAARERPELKLSLIWNER